MKRVLVTGASGFIGRWTLAPLVARGFEVHAVDVRRPSSSPAGVVWHDGDLLAPGGAARAIAEVGPTHLLHLAWYAAHRLFWSSPENLRWVSASLDLVRAFRDAGGERAVLAGTCAEYDAAHGWCSERTTPLAPSTLYGASKDALRRTVEAYASQQSMSWAWGRVFLLHGPDEHPDRLLPAVVGSMLRGEPTRCSHGRQIRDFLHVADVGAAFASLLDTPVQGPVNIASGEPRALREIVTAAAQVIGTPQLVRFGDVVVPASEPPLLVADVRRLREEVGFEPAWSFEAGVADTVAWWRTATGT